MPARQRYVTRPTAAIEAPRDARGRAGLAAWAGAAGAIAASSCCVLPLVLFSVGVSGAWIGNLVALEPYKPIFIALAALALGYGYWNVYRTQKACAAEGACARPLPNRLVKGALWGSTGLVLIALFWDWIAPVLAPLLLGL